MAISTLSAPTQHLKSSRSWPLFIRESTRQLSQWSLLRVCADRFCLLPPPSDCSSAHKGGDLGFFGRGQMQRPFEEATFALPVGGLSGIVQTDSGAHIILRTA